MKGWLSRIRNRFVQIVAPSRLRGVDLTPIHRLEEMHGMSLSDTYAKVFADDAVERNIDPDYQSGHHERLDK